ncbi:hypothetical protein C8R43DRAFT_1028828 [Mycena crocata]|nr:hypothetical protein C8R43DRAFT_1028828 [Mycena crocata]
MQPKTSYLSAPDFSALVDEGISTIGKFVSSGGPMRGAVGGLAQLRKRARHYSEQVIENAADGSKGVITKIKEHITTIVQDATALHDEFLTNIKRSNGGTVDNESQSVASGIKSDLERAFAAVLKELKIIFPPPDQAPGNKERQKSVAVTLEKAGTVFVSVLAKYGMEERVGVHWDIMRPAIRAVVVLLGDLVEQHPDLFGALLVVIMAEIPTGWILLSFLNLFGLGTLKGTPASWAQRIFYRPVMSKL